MGGNYKDTIIGIVGCGFVGGAMKKSFEEKGFSIKAYDKYKSIGSQEDILASDIVFLNLPTVYVEGFGYDLGPIKDTCAFLSKNNFMGIVVVKSTVEPGICQKLADDFELCVIHNPEFLTERTAFEDFHNQKHIVIGYTRYNKLHCKYTYPSQYVAGFYEEIYPDAEISISTSNESELMKIFCNNFYAVKVQLFNEFYLLTQKMNSDFEKVKEMMLKNGWINPMHTKVPGPDGKFSYGGRCFIKDTSALNHFLKVNGCPNKVLEAAIKERNEMRKDEV